MLSRFVALPVSLILKASPLQGGTEDAGGSPATRTQRVVIKDVVADDNHRQGMSVISALGLLVENCTFSGTNGTSPMAVSAAAPFSSADDVFAKK